MEGFANLSQRGKEALFESIRRNTMAPTSTGGQAARASGSAATINNPSGNITTGVLTLVAGGTTTITLTNSQITPGAILLASVANYTNTGGTPLMTTATP